MTHRRHAAQLSAKASIGIRRAVNSAIQLGVVFSVAYAANALHSMNDINSEASDAGTIYAVVFLILDANFVVGQFGPCRWSKTVTCFSLGL
jgi:ATP-binding cassette subfamily B (MDR/TAP) protein 1